MKKRNKMVRYEESAEIRSSIKGWVCTACDRYWGNDEHMARFCCANDMPCQSCKGRAIGVTTLCHKCLIEFQAERCEKLLNEARLCQRDGDPFFVKGQFYASVEEYKDGILSSGATPEKYGFLSNRVILQINGSEVIDNAIDQAEIDTCEHGYPDLEGVEDFLAAIERFNNQNKNVNFWTEDNSRKFEI